MDYFNILVSNSIHKNDLFVKNVINIFSYLLNITPNLIYDKKWTRCLKPVNDSYESITTLNMVLLTNFKNINLEKKEIVLEIMITIFNKYNIWYEGHTKCLDDFKECNNYHILKNKIEKYFNKIKKEITTEKKEITLEKKKLENSEIIKDENYYSSYNKFINNYSSYLVNIDDNDIIKIFEFLFIATKKVNNEYINVHMWRYGLDIPVVLKYFRDNDINIIKCRNSLKHDDIYESPIYFPSDIKFWNFIKNKTKTKIFISIPKTATCSITHEISYTVDTYINLPKGPPNLPKGSPSLSSIKRVDINFFGHMFGKHYNVNKELLFTCYRNPYTRAISGYKFIMQLGFFPHWSLYLISILYRNFKEWITYGLDPKLLDFTNYYLADFREIIFPQYAYVLNDNNELILDKKNIIRFENIDDDFFRLFNKKITNKYNVSESFAKDYSYDEFMANKVYEIYKKDFEIFGYDKDSYVN